MTVQPEFDSQDVAGPLPGTADASTATSTWSASSSKRPRHLATDTVVHYLEDVIFHGPLEPGDALPSEAELAETLNLSRLTVREAVRSMQARGLIEISHGRRPVIAHPNARPLSDFFSASVRRDSRSLLELIEVRLAVEVHTAHLAALHGTSGDLAAIAAHLYAMQQATNDETAFNEADVKFHAAIAAASGNRMLSFLVEGMEGPLQFSRLESVRGHLNRSKSLDQLVDDHTKIYECIQARDPRGAVTMMRRHLVETKTDLKAALSPRAQARLVE